MFINGDPYVNLSDSHHAREQITYSSLQDMDRVLNKVEEPYEAIVKSDLNVSTRKSHKYDHIESKVKQYRMEIRNLHRRRISATPVNHRLYKIKDSDESTSSPEDSMDYKKLAEERKVGMEILEEQNRNLLEKVADLECRMDELRVNLSPAQPLDNKPVIEGAFSAFRQNPFRALSNAIVTPVRNVSNTFLQTIGQSTRNTPAITLQSPPSLILSGEEVESVISPPPREFASPVGHFSMAGGSNRSKRSLFLQVKKRIGKIASRVSFKKKGKHDSESSDVGVSPAQENSYPVPDRSSTTSLQNYKDELQKIFLKLDGIEADVSEIKDTLEDIASRYK